MTLLCEIVGVSEGGFSFGTDSTIHWEFLLQGSIWLGSGLSFFEAELAGVLGLVHGICYLHSHPGLDGPTQNWYSSYIADI